MNQKTTHLSSRLESSVCALAKNNHQVKMLVYTGYPFFFFFFLRLSCISLSNSHLVGFLNLLLADSH